MLKFIFHKSSQTYFKYFLTEPEKAKHVIRLTHRQTRSLSEISALIFSTVCQQLCNCIRSQSIQFIYRTKHR
jgi:hypothetical protein